MCDQYHISDQESFDRAFNLLSGKNRIFLELFLRGYTDQELVDIIPREYPEIFDSVPPDDPTRPVRYRVRCCVKHFRLQTEINRNFSHRDELIDLFINYRSELVCSNLRGEIASDFPENSSLYIERPPIESQCHQEILKPGSLIRVMSPRHTGKTKLLNNILGQARNNRYLVSRLDFQMATDTELTSYKELLKWMCAGVSEDLNEEFLPERNWREILGDNRNCTNYLDSILQKLSKPIIIGLDSVDLIFDRSPVFFSDFCNLLRGWYDLAQSDNIWRELRLVMVHDTEVYGLMSITSSPLRGVGIEINLPDFTNEQAQRLAYKFELNLNACQIGQIMDITGGIPYLLYKSFNFLKINQYTFNELLKISDTAEGPFNRHLRYQLHNLQDCPELATEFRNCISSQNPIEIQIDCALRLHRIGLIMFHGNLVSPRCNLYRNYFRRCL